MTATEKQKALEAIRAYSAKLKASPEALKEALTESGIYLENGELAPQYREPDAA